MRICEVCGAEFEPKQKRSKYCSRECQVRAYSLKRTVREPKKCEWCGKEFTPEYRHTKYCSSECKKASYDDLQRKYAEKRGAKRNYPERAKPIKTERETLICLNCGKEFVPRNGNQIFCTRECTTLYHRKLNQPASREKICPKCGKKFIPLYPNRKYCSDECRKKKVYKYSIKIVKDAKEKPKKKLSPASKRWAKMSWERLTEELLYYGIKYRDAQVMAENNTLPKDFGLKRKRCNK